MGATTTLVTVQEFLQLPEPDGQRIELIGGELVTMGAGRIPHEVVKSRVIQLLAVWPAQNPIGQLFSETMYHLDEHNALIPNISVLFPGRIPRDSTGWFQGAPEIAIEVVSSETAVRLETKIDLYLTHGGKSVWAVFPDRRLVRIFDAAGQTRKFAQHQTIEDPVLPGFRAPVSSLFEGL